MNIELIIDPNNQLSNNTGVMEACGLIPFWLLHPLTLDLSAQECLEKHYMFGCNWTMLGEREGEITQEGVFCYPGDEDLHPILKVIRGEDIIYQYSFGIVSIISPSKIIWGRLD